MIVISEVTCKAFWSQYIGIYSICCLWLGLWLEEIFVGLSLSLMVSDWEMFRIIHWIGANHTAFTFSVTAVLPWDSIHSSKPEWHRGNILIRVLQTFGSWLSSRILNVCISSLFNVFGIEILINEAMTAKIVILITHDLGV